MDCIKNRRTIRKYKETEVEASLLNELLEEAFRASTMGNMQLYSVVVTRSTEMKKKLAPAHFNQPMVMNAPVILTFCADFNRFSKWCKCRQAEPGYDNPISFINAASDALFGTQNFCTLAEAFGLGICYLGTTIYNPDQIIEILQLPELVMPIATITVGYPDEYPAQPERLPIEGLLHEEIYHDYTSEDIDKIYMEKESLRENQYYVDVNKKETLAQVFTDIRYKKSDNEFMSKNSSTVREETGSYADWFEIYNTTNKDIDLGGDGRLLFSVRSFAFAQILQFPVGRCLCFADRLQPNFMLLFGDL